MIKLSSRNAMVLGPDGKARTMDLDALREDLRRSFQRCGIREPWTADQVAMVVEEHVTERDRHPTPILCEADVHAIVISLLCANGFADVGQEYQHLHRAQTRCGRADATLTVCDASRVRHILATSLPLDAEALERLAQATSAALAGLGLERATTELIRQVAIHLVHRDAHAVSPPEPADHDGVWLLPPGQWPVDLVSSETAGLVARKHLEPLPVSRVLPRARAVLDLARVAAARAPEGLTELAFLPALHRCARAAAELLEATTRLVAARTPGRRPLPPRLLTRGFETALASHFVPMCPRSAALLRSEVQQVLADGLLATCGPEAILTFSQGRPPR
ncbi:MAG: hypothetical protein JXR77_02010 [Lentisphaeria bacterium]|nr:hypothetical protein [Lentisphaeria bacterium]